MRPSIVVLAAALLATAACGGRTLPPPPPAPVVFVEEPLPATPAPAVWTSRAPVVLRTDAGFVTLDRPLMRLDVIAGDSAGYHVRCRVCDPTVEGHVAADDVTTPTLSPLEAAEHGSVVEFALAVRHAASLRDLEALRPVMDALFMYSFETEGGRVEALARWVAEDYRSLDRAAALIDRGIVSRWEGTGIALREELWLAPPEFRGAPAFPYLRTGFRRIGGRWTWAYLVGPG
jgi:hypothetical protein